MSSGYGLGEIGGGFMALMANARQQDAAIREQRAAREQSAFQFMMAQEQAREQRALRRQDAAKDRMIREREIRQLEEQNAFNRLNAELNYQLQRDKMAEESQQNAFERSILLQQNEQNRQVQKLAIEKAEYQLEELRAVSTLRKEVWGPVLQLRNTVAIGELPPETLITETQAKLRENAHLISYDPNLMQVASSFGPLFREFSYDYFDANQEPFTPEKALQTLQNVNFKDGQVNLDEIQIMRHFLQGVQIDDNTGTSTNFNSLMAAVDARYRLDSEDSNRPSAVRRLFEKQLPDRQAQSKFMAFVKAGVYAGRPLTQEQINEHIAYRAQNRIGYDAAIAGLGSDPKASPYKPQVQSAFMARMEQDNQKHLLSLSGVPNHESILGIQGRRVQTSESATDNFLQALAEVPSEYNQRVVGRKHLPRRDEELGFLWKTVESGTDAHNRFQLQNLTEDFYLEWAYPAAQNPQILAQPVGDKPYLAAWEEAATQLEADIERKTGVSVPRGFAMKYFGPAATVPTYTAQDVSLAPIASGILGDSYVQGLSPTETLYNRYRQLGFSSMQPTPMNFGGQGSAGQMQQGAVQQDDIFIK